MGDCGNQDSTSRTTWSRSYFEKWAKTWHLGEITKIYTYPDQTLGCVAGLPLAPTPSRRDSLLAPARPAPGHGGGTRRLATPLRRMTQRCAGCALHIPSAPRAQPSALRRYVRAHNDPGPLGFAALSGPRGKETYTKPGWTEAAQAVLQHRGPDEATRNLGQRLCCASPIANQFVPTASLDSAWFRSRSAHGDAFPVLRLCLVSGAKVQWRSRMVGSTCWLSPVSQDVCCALGTASS